MIRLVRLFLVVLAFFCFSPSNAEEMSGNILDNNNWSGSVTPCSNSSCWGGTSGGQTPSWNGTTFRWGYGGGTVSQQIALSQVFSDMGIDILGFYYHWHIKNYNANNQFGSPQDPLDIAIKLYGDDGSILEEYNYDYGYSISDWTHFGGTEYFDKSYGLGDLSYLQLSATGDDAGYWAGWYGPELTIYSLNLVYDVDPCIANPLASTTCEGYAEAYYEQQCSMDALYDQGCVGYEQAYYNQQCTFDALYDSGCPGYEEAYYEKQCSMDALYDTGCPGYAEAYFNQQCTLDALYDETCPGYEKAYEAKMCSMDSQWSPKCPGYVVEIPIIETYSPPVETPIEQTVQESPVEIEELYEEKKEEYIEVVETTKQEEEIKNDTIETTSEQSSGDRERSTSRSSAGVGLSAGIADRLVARLITSSIATGDTSASESQTMNQMMNQDNELFAQMTDSSSTNETNDSNSAAGVGPVVVVIIPPDTPVEEQKSLAEKMAEMIRKKKLDEQKGMFGGQISTLEKMASATDLNKYYDQSLQSNISWYDQKFFYDGNKIGDKDRSYYMLNSENYGLMRELVRSQY